MKMYRLVALAGLAFVLPQIVHAQAPAEAPAASTAETRLAHISVVSIGAGDPVVLIPGLASPRAVWDGIAPALATGHRVLLVQVNGFGGDDSGANAGEGLLSGVEADIIRYLDDNHIARAAVIGHSMGGLIGMMLAKDHPERLSKLMIVDSLPFFGVLMGPGASVDAVRPMAARMRDSVRGGTGAQTVPANMSNSEAGRAQVTAWLNASNRAATGEAIYEDMTTDLRGDVAAIGRVPLTIVYAVPNAGMAQMANALYQQAYAAAPGARLVPVTDSYHFIMLDQPDRFRDAVDAFLAD
jgi:pimeloyl-ACP methyl ester carboxylesterase